MEESLEILLFSLFASMILGSKESMENKPLMGPIYTILQCCTGFHDHGSGPVLTSFFFHLAWLYASASGMPKGKS